ncbi:MAG: nuclear transport factor 2 family protein [Fimbriimonadaceae bacterium]
MNSKRLVVIGAVLVAAASSMADLRSDTQKQFDKYCAAVKRKDGKGIEKVLRANFAPDFKFIPKKGKSVNLSQWIADERMMISVTQTVISVSLHVDSMKMGKGAAAMTITLRYAGMAKMDPKGKTGLLKYVATSAQTMVRKNGKWWITELKEGNSKSTFNGKPFGT